MAIPLLAPKPRLIRPPLRKAAGPVQDLAYALWLNEPGGAAYEALRQTALLPGTSASRVATRYGLATHIDGSGNSGIKATAPFAPMVTSTGDGLGNFTVLYVANPPAVAIACLSSVYQSDSNVSFAGWIPNTNSAAAASSGLMGFQTPSCIVATTGVVLDGNYHVFIVTRSVSGAVATLTLFIDGVQVGQSQVGTTVDNVAANSSVRLEVFDGAEGAIFAHNVVFACAWNRLAAPIEIAEMNFGGLWELLVDYGSPVMMPLPLPPGIWRGGFQLPRRPRVMSDTRLRR